MGTAETADTVAGLTGFERRGAGSDAERRAATWLAGELAAPEYPVRLEPFWCRPNWALAHAWHVALALAGSLVSVSAPSLGGALILLALLSALADEVLGISLGRRLTPERASQNVIAAPRGDDDPDGVRLVITANYDAGRTGLVYRGAPRSAAATLRRVTGGLGPGWIGWLAIAFVWLLATAVLRREGDRGTAVEVAQLVATVALLPVLAMWLELASAEFGPGAGDNASGVAAGIAVARALQAQPPRNLTPELLLQGAGDQTMTGLRRYLHARRKTRGASNTVVLGIAPCGAGQPRWWISDGPLVPRRCSGPVCSICREIASGEPALGLEAYRGRGATPTLPARSQRLPGTTIGCLDERGLAPRSHLASDLPESVDPEALDTTVQLALILVEAIDAYVGRVAEPAPQVTPA
jgi:Peptidase family M28